MKKKTIALILALTVLLGGAIAYGVTSSGRAALYPMVDTKIQERDTSLLNDPVWYSSNTIGAIGISLRDEYPSLTSKWYHVLPVDLSQDGEQVFPLVASNLYYLGNATVSVSGDAVTVTYDYHEKQGYELYGKDETLAWFTCIEEITHDFLENPSSDLTFGTAISKKDDLNGQDYALLFICNHLTYRTPLDNTGAMPTRYWPNHPRMADYFSTAKALLEKVAEDHAAKLAEKKTAEKAEAVEEAEAEPAEAAMDTDNAAAETAPME